MAIRGYTLFRFGEDGLVAERWSNHDHEYRLVQWEGPQAAEKGRRLKRFLNGPSLCEEEVVGRLAALEAALGILAPAEEREAAVRACLAPGAQVHGIGDGPVGPAGLLQHYAELWEAVPDLVFHHDATLSAWGYGAVRWRATGYVAGAFRGVGPSDDAAVLHGETIVRYDDHGLIDMMWSNEYLERFIDQIRLGSPDRRP